MHRAAIAATFVALAAFASAGLADTVYKCMADGRTIYQQTPCARRQRQETIHLPDGNATAAPPSSTPPPLPDRTDDAPSPMPAAASTPVPRLFGCIRATDGKPYTSANGDPAPYAAPLGVLGAIDGALTDTYGRPGAAVASAPELNRGKGNAAAVATRNYVWVKDTCRPLSRAETCQALRDEAEANQRQIRNAFKSERAPLDARDGELRSQLQGCG